MAKYDREAKKDDPLENAKQCFARMVEAEGDNRRDALDDLKFARLGEQWPENERKKRESTARPMLTINKLPAFIRQVVNDARQNKPAIKVRPADSKADPATAEVMNGLIRNIEQSSNADVAYDTAGEFAVSMGWGYIRVTLEYAHDDTFDRDLVIERVANPFCVYGDPHSTAADSSDWNEAFVTELMPRDQFKRRWKGAEEVDWSESGYEGLKTPWREDDEILVAEYWCREEVAKKIVLLSDGQVMDEAVYRAQKDLLDALGVHVMQSRGTRGYKVTQRLMTGAEILETNSWAGKYIPLIPVYGDEVNVEGKRCFRSLIRDAKDAQRMFNYWRTTTTELVALAPKVPYIGPKDAFNSAAAKWETINADSWAYVEYDGPVAPQRQPLGSEVPAGALQEALNASDDMKAIMGIYDASLGARSNETSGRAIMARQREGDVSTFHFLDNLSRAIRHTGRVLIDLIPLVYTAGRIVRVLGPEGDVGRAQLGEQANPAAGVFDLGAGKYDLVVEAGPSFTTRRVEAAEQITAMFQAMPESALILGDLWAKMQDWPFADEVEKRLTQYRQAKLGAEGGPPPEMQKLAQDHAQMAQENQALKVQLEGARQDKLIDAKKLEIDAFKAETERAKAQAEIGRTVHEMNKPPEMPQPPAAAPPMPQQIALDIPGIADAASNAMAQQVAAILTQTLTPAIAQLTETFAKVAAPRRMKRTPIRDPKTREILYALDEPIEETMQ